MFEENVCSGVQDQLYFWRVVVLVHLQYPTTIKPDIEEIIFIHRHMSVFMLVGYYKFTVVFFLRDFDMLRLNTPSDVKRECFVLGYHKKMCGVRNGRWIDSAMSTAMTICESSVFSKLLQKGYKKPSRRSASSCAGKIFF